ncbi:hypothetical protein THAOC_33597 [Thalassiosira oceanica]|uniref:Aminotransferase class I/classII large domain-containing protein n=1 Tax=Thalassiosira oceanica TaxID=159749 RepID=K0R6U6_THAOC|nr:hypothetical protein THAOC_33597 [Thalassiosira oceanica]|eukprot:EJK47669.1 hypothetical protein THAOC_33597 [Thalassiosira oceanica]
MPISRALVMTATAVAATATTTQLGTGVRESTIRLMTRLAGEHGAVNLSQGFPNEAPPLVMRLALAHAVISGQSPESVGSQSTDDLIKLIQSSCQGTSGTRDELNQYSPPMGRPDSRQAVSDYYSRLYGYDWSSDDITLTLGATEAMATALRTCCKPSDRYPSQCHIFSLQPEYVTLREENGEWHYDFEELRRAVEGGAKALILNTPHNPTGKVFCRDELEQIVHLCLENRCYIITDEIYEHMTYDRREHILIPREFPLAREWTLVCNSIGKSASATGWRLGWCLTPPRITASYRGVHDQLVCMAPHPMQFAGIHYFGLPDDFFRKLHTRYRERIERTSEALIAAGFRVVKPQGAYYLFVHYRSVQQLRELDNMQAAMHMLINVGVAVVPGNNFYGKCSEGGNYLRFAVCRSDEDIDLAIARIKEKLTPC